jgi:hypothetical protein
LKGTGFSPSVENKVEMPALPAEEMLIATRNLPQGLKPRLLQALMMYGLKPVPSTKALLSTPNQFSRQILRGLQLAK